LQKFFSLLPRGLSSLLDYISPSAFDVVDWKAALTQSKQISQRLLFRQGVSDAKVYLNSYLREDVSFDSPKESTTRKLQYESSTPTQRSLWGQSILRIYFLQLRLGKQSFLDLRIENFRAFADNRLLWAPNGLLTSFSKSFLDGLNKTYEGFYDDDSTALNAGLSNLGLLPAHLSESQKKELLGLLYDHFGAGRSSPMQFKTSHFMESFDRLFVFLRDQQIRLAPDFLFLGVQLLTLYMHLEKCGESLNVCEAFEWAKKRATEEATAAKDIG
jgi:predicted unusual protein kinase regulating ubiquinone biosynthesis (AarF/ABC1/UbiB family)